MIFLTAPVDLHETGAYEASLRMLHRRYENEPVSADRDSSEDTASYSSSDGASALYVLAREDGTISAEVYRRWEHLSGKHGVPATLLFPVGDSAAELGNFTVSLPGASEGSDRSFASVTPEAVASSTGGSIPEVWGRSR